MEALSTLAAPFIALLRPAAEAVAGDWYRRWKIEGRYHNDQPSKHSSVVEKAIEDLEGFVAREGFLTTSVAGFLEELKATGTLHAIARNAFYDIKDESTRLRFELMFSRHVSDAPINKQKEIGEKLFDATNFILRESIRFQTRNDLLYIFENTTAKDRDEFLESKRTEVIQEMRSDISESLSLSVTPAFATSASTRIVPSGYERSAFPSWLYISPQHCAESVTRIASALAEAYETIRVDGPAQKSVDCLIDKLYVTARLRTGSFSVQRNELFGISAKDRHYTDLLGTITQCVILGDPGGGKSTLAQRICLDLARVARKDGGQPLAVRVEIRRFRQRADLEPFHSLIEFIASELSRQTNLYFIREEWVDLVRHLLFHGRMLVIFDGIDEIISAAQRREVIAATKQFTSVFSQNRFIFTCRKTDFQITPISSSEIYLLQQFNSQDIREYFRSASRWVFDKSQAQIAEEEPSFIRQASNQAEEFTHSPLLLALIVWIYSVGQRIPDNRIELYAECSDLLFRRWDSLKALDPNLPDAHWLFQLVTEIAQRLYFYRSDEGPPNLDWLKEQVLEFFRNVYEIDAENRARDAAERFADHLIGRSWILQETSAGSFEFSHRTFMEYYYARWLDDTFDGIEPLFEHAKPHILLGEQSVPIHLAFQMKAAGKLKSAETLISAFIKLIEATAGASRLQSRASRPLLNAVSFFIEGTDYLQPSEVWMTRIAREISLAVKTTDEWRTAIGRLIDRSKKFRSAIADGIRLAVTEMMSEGDYSKGFVVDWLYACYLSDRTLHSVAFSPVVLKYDSVKERFDVYSGQLAASSRHRPVSGLKMVFDLSRIIVPHSSDAGLDVWSSSQWAGGRLDWRLVDFSLGALESAALLANTTETTVPPYAKLFADVAPRVIEQPSHMISGGPLITTPFDYSDLHVPHQRLLTGRIEIVRGYAVALIGTAELVFNLPQQGDREQRRIPESLPIGQFNSHSLLRLIGYICERQDLGENMRKYLKSWIEGDLRMFDNNPRHFVPSYRAFGELSGLDR